MALVIRGMRKTKSRCTVGLGIYDSYARIGFRLLCCISWIEMGGCETSRIYKAAKGGCHGHVIVDLLEATDPDDFDQAQKGFCWISSWKGKESAVSCFPIQFLADFPRHIHCRDTPHDLSFVAYVYIGTVSPNSFPMLLLSSYPSRELSNRPGTPKHTELNHLIAKQNKTCVRMITPPLKASRKGYYQHLTPSNIDLPYSDFYSLYSGFYSPY